MLRNLLQLQADACAFIMTSLRDAARDSVVLLSGFSREVKPQRSVQLFHRQR